MAYTKTTWINGSPPPLNATNLNHIERGIADAHDLVDGLSARYGTPLAASTVAEMTDTTKIYVYTGSETGYTNGNWYYYDSTLETPQWVSGGIYNSVAVQTDTSLTQAGMAADAKKVGDEISDLTSQIGDLSELETEDKTDLVSAINEANQNGGTGSGLTEEIKQALLQLAQNVAYIDEYGQDVYDALTTALYPPVDLSYITAVYTQSGTVYVTDSLDDLKDDLVVTAHYSDSSSSVITTYVLSGTLTEGTSTITVSYGGKTTTFTVTVTDDRHVPTEYTWLYESKDGQLLSANENVDYSTTGTVSETLVDGYLRLHANSRSQSGGAYNRYALGVTTTNAKLSCRVKLVDLLESVAGNYMGFRFLISNGTSGAQVCTMNPNGDGYIRFIYYQGTTAKTVNTELSVDDWHIIELELVDGKQKCTVDGSLIFETSTLSTNYNTTTSIFNQAGASSLNPNGVTTLIDWVAFYNREA